MRITKVNIRVTLFVHFHLCLLNVFVSYHCVAWTINLFSGGKKGSLNCVPLGNNVKNKHKFLN